MSPTSKGDLGKVNSEGSRHSRQSQRDVSPFFERLQFTWEVGTADNPSGMFLLFLKDFNSHGKSAQPTIPAGCFSFFSKTSIHLGSRRSRQSQRDVSLFFQRLQFTWEVGATDNPSGMILLPF
jgi:serine/threonine protein kinase HipA of HipAB toxin-antitoxin module